MDEVKDSLNEEKDPINCAFNAICDAARYLGDASYAVLPRDMAHSLGEFKKSFLNNVKHLVEKDIEWVDARVAGGDRLREEWKEACARDDANVAGEPEPAS